MLKVSFVHHVFDDFHDGLPLDFACTRWSCAATWRSLAADDVERGLTIRNAPKTRVRRRISRRIRSSGLLVRIRRTGASRWELTERGKRELKRVQKPLMQSV